VCLRPLKTDDFTALYAVARDPLIWLQHFEKNRYEEPVFRAFFTQALNSGGALLATEATTGTVIGSSRFQWYDPAASEMEIGWTFLGRSYWGGRYNGEMKRLMLDHAFQYVEHVLFFVRRENRRSQIAVERIGGVRIAERPHPSGTHPYCYRIDKKRFP